MRITETQLRSIVKKLVNEQIVPGTKRTFSVTYDFDWDFFEYRFDNLDFERFKRTLRPGANVLQFFKETFDKDPPLAATVVAVDGQDDDSKIHVKLVFRDRAHARKHWVQDLEGGEPEDFDKWYRNRTS